MTTWINEYEVAEALRISRELASSLMCDKQFGAVVHGKDGMNAVTVVSVVDYAKRHAGDAQPDIAEVAVSVSVAADALGMSDIRVLALKEVGVLDGGKCGSGVTCESIRRFLRGGGV